jgi:uncharacterized membrane protein YedE/YeeE
MTIDWMGFTPWRSLAGGLLIGSAVAMFALLNGRIAGISGILGGLLERGRTGLAWRAAFLIGLLAAPLAYAGLAEAPRLQIDASDAALVIAGFLVGIGTRYASGCTSGHGVCGISRGSVRSIVATGCFRAAGFLTVFLMRHVLGLQGATS